MGHGEEQDSTLVQISKIVKNSRTDVCCNDVVDCEGKKKNIFRLISDPKYNHIWAAHRCESMLFWSGTVRTSDQHLYLTGFHTKSACLTSHRAISTGENSCIICRCLQYSPAKVQFNWTSPIVSSYMRQKLQ